MCNKACDCLLVGLVPLGLSVCVCVVMCVSTLLLALNESISDRAVLRLMLVK